MPELIDLIRKRMQQRRSPLSDIVSPLDSASAMDQAQGTRVGIPAGQSTASMAPADAGSGILAGASGGGSPFKFASQGGGAAVAPQKSSTTTCADGSCFRSSPMTSTSTAFVPPDFSDKQAVAAAAALAASRGDYSGAGAILTSANQVPAQMPKPVQDAWAASTAKANAAADLVREQANTEANTARITGLGIPENRAKEINGLLVSTYNGSTPPAAAVDAFMALPEGQTVMAESQTKDGSPVPVNVPGTGRDAILRRQEATLQFSVAHIAGAHARRMKDQTTLNASPEERLQLIKDTADNISDAMRTNKLFEKSQQEIQDYFNSSVRALMFANAGTEAEAYGKAHGMSEEEIELLAAKNRTLADNTCSAIEAQVMKAHAAYDAEVNGTSEPYREQTNFPY